VKQYLFIVPIGALNNYAHYLCKSRVAGLLEQTAVIVKILKKKEQIKS